MSDIIDSFTEGAQRIKAANDKRAKARVLPLGYIRKYTSAAFADTFTELTELEGNRVRVITIARSLGLPTPIAKYLIEDVESYDQAVSAALRLFCRVPYDENDENYSSRVVEYERLLGMLSEALQDVFEAESEYVADVRAIETDLLAEVRKPEVSLVDVDEASGKALASLFKH